ncbi:hypothetical protein Dimus_009913 [Dionaea muscipula]
MGEEKDQHEGPAKNKDNNGNKNKKKDKDSGSKKEEKPITVVLKVDLHCLGCTARVKKAILHFHGVDMVKEGEDNKLTVVGIGVDPVNLRDMVEKKMKKKVDLISPQPKKDKDGGGGNKKQDAGDGGGSSNNNNRKKAEEKQNNDDDDKKKPYKEPPVTTAVLKVAYHCHGCGQKIHKTVSTYKGVHTVSIDKENDVVRVTGTMDAKALAECLKEKLRRPVEVVPEKKEKDKEKEKKKGGEEEERGNQGGKKKKEGGGGGGGGGENGDNNYKLQGNKNELGGGGGGGASSKKIEYAMSGSGYMCWDESSGYVVDILHAPQWFSEENVNGCVVM